MPFTCALPRPSEPEGEATGDPGLESGDGIDGDVDDRVRILLSDLLDLGPALAAGDERRAAGRAVEQERQVELSVDRDSLLHEHSPDDAAGGAGLLRDEDVTEHALRNLPGRVGIGNDHHPAQGGVPVGALDRFTLRRPEEPFPAAAGVDLRLHDDGAAEPLGHRAGPGRVERRLALGHRDAVLPEYRLRLMFVDIQVGYLRRIGGRV